ncbi:CMRF35-like molecule 7 [Periophthalmus magnuspinnatus]|uniref:CMRF35-like molecule 7 n=1 Tax=Periophthalmus magnuspinnatus TaxID=409849 RepID=UPI00145AE778|nr:CMRF35-like molecule 7 [Periophthalmus magnuspinnatus]
MTFMHLCFVDIVLLLGGFWAVEVEAFPLSAEEGKTLVIECSHSNAHGNIKYFCKDPCDYRDVLIMSRQKDQNRRYSINDTGNTFYVTISGLTKEDSGVYWCGVERVGKDTYNYVSITVTPSTFENSPNASLQNRTSIEKLLYIGMGLGALLFILLIAGVIFIKHRRRDISKPMGDNTLTDPFRYHQRQFKDTTIVCSANQSSEPDLLTAEHDRGSIQEPTSDIYANVQTVEEGYSSVRFTKHKNRITCTDSESTVVYSPVNTA